MKKVTIFLVFMITAVHSLAQHNGVTPEIRELHERVFTVDSHTDTPLRFYPEGVDIGLRNDPRETGSKIDLPRMEEGGLDAAFFAVWIGQGERDEKTNQRVYEQAVDMIRVVKEQAAKYPEKAAIVTSPQGAYAASAAGKRAIFIGLENGYPVGNNLGNVQTFYDLGARYITLSHTANNDICDSSDDPDGPEHDGLSGFGEEVVKEMNRLGMIIDISHVSDDAFYDVIELSSAPVVASHSCVRSLVDHPRNMTDDMIQRLAANGGVLQIAAFTRYLTNIEQSPERTAAREALREKYGNFSALSPERKMEARKEWREIDKKYPRKLASVSDLVDHIDYVVELVGIEHVGIGTDFDGGGELKDCYDVSEIPAITAELVKRGYSEEEIALIWGGNFMRVFDQVIAGGTNAFQAK